MISCVQVSLVHRRVPWRQLIDAPDAPLALIVGHGRPLDTRLSTIVRAEGWDVRELIVPGPVVPVSNWADVALVIVVGHPGDDAAALLDALHRAGCDAPLLFVSAKMTTAKRRRALVLGALDVIALPADAREFRARVRAVLHAEKPRAIRLHP